jgi:aryl-alcohol dehydrogenase-like predicted oxidoreductase
MNGRPTAAAAGKIDVGGDLTVNRLGFGAMRITGPGIWGDPPDRDRAREALRRAVALDVTFIDTADSYGPEVSPAILSAARRHGASERQVVLAWLLARSPQMLPIPGSGFPEHVEQNIAAARRMGRAPPPSWPPSPRCTLHWRSPKQSKRPLPAGEGPRSPRPGSFRP